MVSTYTPNKNIQKPASGDLSGAWAAPVNADWTSIDTALGSSITFSATTGSQTLTSGISDTYSYIPLVINVINPMSANVTYTIPSGVGGQWIVRNTTTDGTGGPWTVTFASAGGGTSAVVDRGISTLIYSDGTNIRYSDNRTRAALAGGSNTQVQYNNSTALAGNAAFIFDSSTGYVGIGNTSPAPTTPSHPLTVKGVIRTTYSSGTSGGGIQFPDGTVQTSAAIGPPSSYVASIDFGSTGLLPSIPSVGAVTVGGVLGIAYGGTGSTSASSARTALGVASSGANSDITSITGLTTALTAAQGGTGQISYINGQLLIGNAGGTLTKSTLTAGSGITINNGNGTIEIVASGTAGVTTFSGGSTGLTPSSATSGAVTLAGTLAVANGGTGVTTSTGSGNNVLSTSPTLTTPNLGTPSALTLTNATGLSLTSGVTNTLPVANGGTGVTSSTGSGSNVLSTSPTFTGTLNAASIITTANISAAGTITLNTGGVTTGTALSLRNGANLTFYNAADTGLVSVACDINGELATDGNFVAAGSVKAQSTGFIFPDSTTQLTAFPAYGAGYQRMPGGLILQWGQSSVAGSTSTTITLPIAFPSTTSAAYLTEIHVSTYSGPYATIGVEILSSTQIRVWNNNGYSMGFYWAAIGY